MNEVEVAGVCCCAVGPSYWGVRWAFDINGNYGDSLIRKLMTRGVVVRLIIKGI
jgi:hypothetical protein